MPVPYQQLLSAVLQNSGEEARLRMSAQVQYACSGCIKNASELGGVTLVNSPDFSSPSQSYCKRERMRCYDFPSVMYLPSGIVLSCGEGRV